MPHAQPRPGAARLGVAANPPPVDARGVPPVAERPKWATPRERHRDGICQYGAMTGAASPGSAETQTVLSISEVHARLRGAVAGYGTVWIEGEVAQIRVSGGHRYLTLTERGSGFRGADCSLTAVCWSSAWSRISAKLTGLGLEVNQGSIVQLRGKLDVWGRTEIVLVADAVNTDALLGRAELEKRKLLESLEKEGILRANRGAVLGLVPLRIGLVAADRTEGLADFLGVLGASPYAFEVTHLPVTVQGVTAPAEIAAAISALVARSVDLIAVVRGGGSRGDLAAFDHERIARAICGSAVPVWCGVGHTGDRSVADEVAHTSHPTPTACAQAIERRVAGFMETVDGALGRIVTSTERLLSEAAASVDVVAARLADAAPRVLEAEGVRLSGLAWRAERGMSRAVGDVTRELGNNAGMLRAYALNELRVLAGTLAERSEAAQAAVVRHLSRVDDRLAVARARISLENANGALALHRERLGARAGGVIRAGGSSLEHSSDLIASRRLLLKAYDPVRQLERGWTLTRDEHGRAIRSARTLAPGATLVTSFADGSISSVVASDQPPGALRPSIDEHVLDVEHEPADEGSTAHD